MVDKLTAERRSHNMRQIKSKGMKPELLVRSLVHKMGFRFRLHAKDLPGKPDLVFRSRRKAIQVHGCFWHAHEHENCLDGRAPKSNVGYWGPKLARNKQRDAESNAALEAQGWGVLTIWECKTKDETKLRKLISKFLGKPGRV